MVMWGPVSIVSNLSIGAWVVECILTYIPIPHAPVPDSFRFNLFLLDEMYSNCCLDLSRG